MCFLGIDAHFFSRYESIFSYNLSVILSKVSIIGMEPLILIKSIYFFALQFKQFECFLRSWSLLLVQNDHNLYNILLSSYVYPLHVGL